jgi:iron complex outermembrane receptor protein
MVGVAGVRDVGDVSYKVRAAYGVGIRPANTSAREMALRDIRRYLAAPALDPEEQSGTEVGADVMVGKRFAVHLTRFDQTASGLIQPVTIPDSQSGPTGPGSGKRLAYVLQNVGEISNHGWELESSLNLGVLSLSGALSTVDSRVQQISRWYTGDLRPGDRMLAVPSKTASLSASWSGSAWYMSATLSRAFDWTNYDRRRLAANYATCSTCTARSFSGDSLRSYWIRYDGVTRLRATLSRDLLRDLSLKVTADNLTNVQEGEPDNITVLPGRTVLVGLSARIR